MNKIAKLIGFAFLHGFIGFLMLRFLLRSSGLTFIGIALLWIVLIIGLFFLYRENEQEAYGQSKSLLWEAFYIALGALVTYSLQPFANVVLASSIIGFLGFIFVKKYESVIFLGSFVGMASSALFPIFPFLLAIILTILVYLLIHPLLKNAGGKAGFIAFSGVFLAYWILHGNVLVTTVLPRFQVSLLDFGVLLIIFFFMRVVNHFNASKVLSSSLVGIFFGLVLFWESGTAITQIAFLAYAYSFFLMAHDELLPMEVQLLAIFIFPWLVSLFQGYYVGFGGKLGMMALLLTVVMVFVRNIIQRLMKKFKQQQEMRTLREH